MEHKNTERSYNTPRSVPLAELARMEMTFTDAGLRTIKAFQRKVHMETGRRVTLAQALDVLIASHPFVARGQR